MSIDHPIRLRGAWDWQVDDAEAPRRLALPTAWPAGLAAPFRLTRRFGRPPLDPGRESLALRLEAVPGLTAVRLNGRLLARPAPGADRLTVDLGPALTDRNVLELEVDPAGWIGAGTGDVPWGSIALVVRTA